MCAMCASFLLSSACQYMFKANVFEVNVDLKRQDISSHVFAPFRQFLRFKRIYQHRRPRKSRDVKMQKQANGVFGHE